MAKEFAKKFYKSKEWTKCRSLVFQRDFGLCVECGSPGEEVHHIKHITPNNVDDPNITLNQDNLITLCKDCHHKAHERNQFTRSNATVNGLIFDEFGNLVLGDTPR